VIESFHLTNPSQPRRRDRQGQVLRFGSFGAQFHPCRIGRRPVTIGSLPIGVGAVNALAVRGCWLCSSVVSNQLPPLAKPAEVAEYLHTTTASLAQDRYRGTGPNFIKRGSRVLYRWSDVLEWLDRNTFQRTDDLRPQR
jgi:hypothetical protein